MAWKKQTVGIAIWLILAFVCCACVNAAITPNRSNNKEVNAFCMALSGGGVQMVLSAAYNGDPVDKVLAVNGDTYTGSNEATCTYTTLNSAGTSIMITSEVYASGSGIGGTNICGARRTPTGNTNRFSWTIELRELFAEDVYTDLDRRYSIDCMQQQALSNVLSTSIRVYDDDEETDATVVKPVNSMSVLLGEDTGNFFPISSNQRVPSGSNIKVQIQTQVPTPYPGGLQHYGIHAFSCRWSVSPDFTSANTGTFILSNGCPSTGNRFGLTNGFQYVSFTGGFYTIQTDAFNLYGFNAVPASSKLHLECYVDYCYGLIFSDGRCSDFCAFSTSQNGRRRRNVANSTNINDRDRVAFTIDIAPQGTGDEGANGGESLKSDTMIIAVSSTLAAIVVAIIVAIVCIVVVGKRRRAQKDDRRSYSSENYLHSNAVLPPKA